MQTEISHVFPSGKIFYGVLAVWLLPLFNIYLITSVRRYDCAATSTNWRPQLLMLNTELLPELYANLQFSRPNSQRPCNCVPPDHGGQISSMQDMPCHQQSHQPFEHIR